LSKFAKQYVTVVLTGEGSDELFAGYPRFHIPLLAQSLRVLPNIFTSVGLEMARLIGNRKVIKLLENAQDGVRAIVENSRFTPGRDFADVCAGVHRFTERMSVYGLAERHSASILERMLYFDQRTYLPALLNRLDKVSMAAAVECRVPYLDYRLIEWSALIPPSLKIRVGWDNKVIVKRVARRWLPREIVSRKKVGFGVPVSRWLRNARGLGRYLDLLTDNTFRARAYCDPKVVERLIYEHLQKGSDHGEILWGLINLEIWWRLFIDSTDSQRIVTMPQLRQPSTVPSVHCFTPINVRGSSHTDNKRSQ
jgi:asparagine synthase (glutamine-hydrolysing)